MKKESIVLRAAAVVVVGVMSFFALGATRLAHAQDGCSYHGSDCAGCSISARSDVPLSDLTEEEQRVIEYVCDQVVESGNVRFDSEDIENATGVSLENIKESTIQAGVVAELKRRNFNIDRLASASNCSRFSACSVNRDLSGATGEELERYSLEKSQDGQTFTDWFAPDFTLPSTAGEQVSLSDYRGKPVALVFLAGHCNHSLQTVPIITELKRKYESQGLVVLPVYVNSGSVEDVEYLRSGLKLNYPLIVSENKDVAKTYESLIVPSVFLIDREGRITKKFVGYKNRSVLDQAFAELASL